MTQNIEQRTLAAVNQYENASDKAHKITSTDSMIDIENGQVKSLPKISKDWEQERKDLSIKSRPVLAWVNGETETDLNQQRRFTDGHTYLPKVVPALMNSEPDTNWIAYTADKSDVLSDVFGSKPVDLVNNMTITPISNQYPKLSVFNALFELEEHHQTITVKSFLETADGHCEITITDNSKVIATKIDLQTEYKSLRKLGFMPQLAVSVGTRVYQDTDLVKIGHINFPLLGKINGVITSINTSVKPYSITDGTNTAYLCDLDKFDNNEYTPEMLFAAGDADSTELTGTDETALLNALFSNSESKTVKLTRKYLIDAESTVHLQSNCVVYGSSKDAGFVMKPNAVELYYGLRAIEKDNIYLARFSIYGERTKHNGLTGEWGMGLGTQNTHNLVCEDLNIYNCWGDGIYLGSSTNVNNRNNVNINLIRCNIDNCRRQGLSVISVDGLLVDGGTISNTNGTSPEAGIDFESNHAHDTMKNIRVTNLVTKGNRSAGILIAPTRSENQEYGIIITNHISTNDAMGLSILKPASGMTGFIKYSNNSITDTKLGAVAVADWDSECSVTINDLTFDSINSDTAQPANLRAVVSLRQTVSSLAKVSNVHIHNIRGVRGVGKTLYDVYLQNADKMENCSISNVDWKKTTGVHLVDVITNDLTVSHDCLELGDDYWPGSVGERDLDIVSHHNYHTKVGSKHIVLKLPAIPSDHTTPVYRFFDLAASLAGNYNISIKTADGTNIAPFTSSQVGYLYSARKKGQCIDFKCIFGQWTVVGSNATVTQF